jgi:hopanoid C-3 methylase
MKILLLNPPRSPENSIFRFAPENAKHFIHKKLIGPPLGLLTIAASVKDFDVSVFDCKGEYDLEPSTPSLDVLVLRLLNQYNPDIVGVTVITSEFDYSLEIFRVTKQYNPEIVTVAGGLHATLCIQDFKGTDADVVIQGQCPHIFRDVVVALEKKKSLESVPGIFLNGLSGFEQTKGKSRPWDATNADYLMPNRRHLDPWISTYKVGNSPFPSTYLFSSLGCPYKCTFCSIWTQFKGKYYQRTVESLITELKSIDEYPVVRFADANTVVDHDFINLLFDRIVEEGIQKTFVMDIRADVASRNPEIIEKLARGGLKVVICGFESFRDEELSKYHKESPAFDNQEAVKVFERNGIMVRGNYVVPDDYDLDDFKALAEYAEKNKVVYAGYTVLTPMPGTIYYRQAQDEIIDFDYKKYNFFNAVTKTKLPFDQFHEEIGKLWLIKKGNDVI